jgi:hypothetical protein
VTTPARSRAAGLAGALFVLMAVVVTVYVATAPVSRAAGRDAANAADRAVKRGAAAAIASTVARAGDSTTLVPVPSQGTLPPTVPSSSPVPPTSAATPAPPPPPTDAPPTTTPPTTTPPTTAPPTTAPPAGAPSVAPAPATPASAPLPPAASAPSPVPHVVGLVGDSLAFAAGGAIDPAFRAAGLRAILDLAPGRRIDVRNDSVHASAGLEAVRGVAAFRPEVMIVQLGTNDVFFDAPDRDRYVALISSVLDEIGRDVPTVWVNVWRTDQPVASQLFDDVLQQSAALDLNLHVADWAAVARAEPVLRPDGVHPNGFGDTRFARTMVDATALAVLAHH